jgi:tetratricopeptide (TPR) repeat protein
VRAWAALRPALVESRFQALHASGLTALVGREEELDLLLRRWSRTKSGEGQVVLLSGEAGIGKSRLTAALLEHLATEPHTRLRYFCSPQHTDSALYPVIGQMERAAGFMHDDKLQAKLDKLDAVLAQTSTSTQDAALFAEMLSLPNDGRYPALNLDPQQRRQKTLEALTAQVEALSRQKPVLMIFEDAHWTDPTSLETFGRVVDRVRSLPVLLIVTFRPEFEPPWIGRPYVTALTINRLGECDIEAVIDHVVGNKLIPVSVRQDIIERADGIPLFVEEMTKAVLEAGSEGAAERIAAAVPSSTLTVPASLQASLMARLDRLGPAKEIAQIGAAIGREFSHALLSAVVSKQQKELASGLDRLIATGLLFRQGVPPHASYLFKHALVQDAAYGTLLREPRRALHARLAGTLESQFTEIAENQPELLARHCTEAGLIEKAASLWGKAGHRSLERSALVEAIEQLQRALDQIATLSTTPELRQEEIRLQVALITPLIHVKGYTAIETKTAIERARQLIERVEELGEAPDDPLLLFAVLFGFFVSNLWTFDGRLCRNLATYFLALAEKQNATAPVLMAHRIMGQTLGFSGDPVGARVHYDKGIALYDPAEHGPLAMRFGHDAQVVMLSFRSWALWLLGYPDAALRDTDDAVKKARAMDQAATLMFALSSAASNDLVRSAYSAVAIRAQELFALAEEKGAAWKENAQLLQGCVLAHTGKALEAVQMITSIIAKRRSHGIKLEMPTCLSHLAWANAELGQFGEAWRYIGDAMTIVETSGLRSPEAEVCRVAGEIALKSPEQDMAKAQAYFDRALAVARAQQAKSWELRAAMSMARLWRDQGKREEARDLLAPVYNWFTEGFDTPDLKEAKALLDELAA